MGGDPCLPPVGTIHERTGWKDHGRISSERQITELQTFLSFHYKGCSRQLLIASLSRNTCFFKLAECYILAILSHSWNNFQSDKIFILEVRLTWDLWDQVR